MWKVCLFTTWFQVAYVHVVRKQKPRTKCWGQLGGSIISGCLDVNSRSTFVFGIPCHIYKDTY